MKEVTSLDVLRWEAWLCAGAALVLVVCVAMVAVYALSSLWGGAPFLRTYRR